MSDYHIKNLEDYSKNYKSSVNNPEKFWAEIAKNNFVWKREWNSVLNWDFNKPEIKWFEGAILNITENCIDRHLDKHANKTAIVFEPNDENEKEKKISYKELYIRVNKMSNVLKSKGVKKGDRVCIYLPMIPELAISVLACARIGAIHSVVFAGFSSTALATRIIDCDCRLVITSDGSFRGNKILDLKAIVDKALDNCPQVSKVLLVNRTKNKISLKKDRDELLAPLLQEAKEECVAEPMQSEDPLFILYTSGSTGKPKGMVHSTAGYMVGAAYTFKNIFQYGDEDIYWCTADIGWVTGHSYIVYGPLLNAATTVMFEGVPSYPDFGRFWKIVEKYRVNQFYTAPTAIRALAKESLDFVNKYNLSSLKVLGSVGEPINEEAWNWYNNHIGKNKCPIVDTWWQTETGSIMISSIPNVIKGKATFATLPFIGIQPVLMDNNGKEILENSVEGRLCVKFPWPSIARTIWGDHQRYKDTYFSTFENHYFTGDGSYRDDQGYYRITGRVDDVIIVSGHNLGTAPIEDAINEHNEVAESAIVGVPHEVKGNSLFGYINLKSKIDPTKQNQLRNEINGLISNQIGPIAKLDQIEFVPGLPKTRSGKIMRRILRKIAHNEVDNLGDVSTLLNPEIVNQIINQIIK
ncbi:MAG: acetate--CoA ligase [Flavobacteriaceae bacterium]|nr:acetate--CoA ligase [Flavobacteriaceae bacterium]|tara:strand:- start:14446 stop:16356 length:1911 start_codon:yes stop_codon:yes gene_type:complete